MLNESSLGRRVDQYEFKRRNSVEPVDDKL
jgi:hypothetical protein